MLLSFYYCRFDTCKTHRRTGKSNLKILAADELVEEADKVVEGTQKIIQMDLAEAIDEMHSKTHRGCPGETMENWVFNGHHDVTYHKGFEPPTTALRSLVSTTREDNTDEEQSYAVALCSALILSIKEGYDGSADEFYETLNAINGVGKPSAACSAAVAAGVIESVRRPPSVAYICTIRYRCRCCASKAKTTVISKDIMSVFTGARTRDIVEYNTLEAAEAADDIDIDEEKPSLGKEALTKAKGVAYSRMIEVQSQIDERADWKNVAVKRRRQWHRIYMKEDVKVGCKHSVTLRVRWNMDEGILDRDIEMAIVQPHSDECVKKREEAKDHFEPFQVTSQRWRL